MSPGPALSHMGRWGARHSSLAPAGRPCSVTEAPGRLVSPLRIPTPSLTVAPGDLALREREPEPPAQHRLLSSRCRARPGGRPGDGLWAQAVSGAAAACTPGGPVGPGLSLTGTCASDRRRGGPGAVGRARAGSPPAEAGGSGLTRGLTRGLWLQRCPRSRCQHSCLPHSPSPAPPGGSSIGRGSSPPQIYFQHPDDRFRAAWAVLHSLLISAWTGCPALAPVPRVCRPGVCVWAPRLSAGGQVGVLPLGAIS